MPDALRNQIFREGDTVRVIGPLAEAYRGETGVVRSITYVGNVYRYVVEFDQGRSDTFFGFELFSAVPPAAHSA